MGSIQGGQETKEERGCVFLSIRLKQFFSQNYHMNWWYSYFTKQRCGKIVMLIFHRGTMEVESLLVKHGETQVEPAN